MKEGKKKAHTKHIVCMSFPYSVYKVVSFYYEISFALVFNIFSISRFLSLTYYLSPCVISLTFEKFFLNILKS